MIQRGHNRQACWCDYEDYRAYLGWLEQYAEESERAIHAYTLMTSHMRLLMTSPISRGAGERIERLGQRYVQSVNRTYRRSGTL